MQRWIDPIECEIVRAQDAGTVRRRIGLYDTVHERAGILTLIVDRSSVIGDVGANLASAERHLARPDVDPTAGVEGDIAIEPATIKRQIALIDPTRHSHRTALVGHVVSEDAVSDPNVPRRSNQHSAPGVARQGSACRPAGNDKAVEDGGCPFRGTLHCYHVVEMVVLGEPVATPPNRIARFLGTRVSTQNGGESLGIACLPGTPTGGKAPIDRYGLVETKRGRLRIGRVRPARGPVGPLSQKNLISRAGAVKGLLQIAKRIGPTGTVVRP